MKNKETEYVKDSCLRMLIEGRYTFAESELLQWAKLLGIDEWNQGFYCLVIKGVQESFDPWMPGRVRTLAEMFMKTMALKGFSCISSSMDVVLLIYEMDENKREIVQKMSTYLTSHSSYRIYVGIGGSYRNLRRISVSKEEAYEALSAAKENFDVVSIEDINHIQDTSHMALSAHRARIIDQFKRNQLDDIADVLSELAEEVRGKTVLRKDAPYPSSIRRTMVELLVEILRIASDSGVDVEKMMEGTDPYRHIFELTCTPDIIEWMVHVIIRLRKAMQERRTMVEHQLVEQAKAHIDGHLADIELSLSLVSDELNMSPAYFSAFFIRKTGVGFKEYVNVKRIEKAQKYLLETTDSINVISEKCGFLSPSYFISVFKKRMGISPGAYRKKNN